MPNGDSSEQTESLVEQQQVAVVPIFPSRSLDEFCYGDKVENGRFYLKCAPPDVRDKFLEENGIDIGRDVGELPDGLFEDFIDAHYKLIGREFDMNQWALNRNLRTVADICRCFGVLQSVEEIKDGEDVIGIRKNHHGSFWIVNLKALGLTNYDPVVVIYFPDSEPVNIGFEHASVEIQRKIGQALYDNVPALTQSYGNIPFGTIIDILNSQVLTSETQNVILLKILEILSNRQINIYGKIRTYLDNLKQYLQAQSSIDKLGIEGEQLNVVAEKNGSICFELIKELGWRKEVKKLTFSITADGEERQLTLKATPTDAVTAEASVSISLDNLLRNDRHRTIAAAITVLLRYHEQSDDTRRRTTVTTQMEYLISRILSAAN